MPVTVLITKEQLKAICTKLHITRAQSLAVHFNLICPQYGINKKGIFHEFFANLCEESGEFEHYEENLYYSAERLMKVWPKKFPTKGDAIPYANNPEKLAERVYGLRKSLGNYNPGDGYAFRGSGPMQLTGRANMTAFANWMEYRFSIKHSPESWADLLRTSDEFGIHSACWIFAIAKKLIDEAERDEMKEIVLKINGGLTNYPKRLAYYEKAKKFIV